MSKKKRFKIIDNPVGDGAGLCLVDENDEIVRIDTRSDRLARYAFDEFDADEVEHDEDLVEELYRTTSSP